MNSSRYFNPAQRRRLQKTLKDWFAREARDLPWRRTSDPYAVWLSEVILQQTRVDQGTPYYERFVEAYPTVEELAKASEDEVLKLWEGLGYYSRARNLHRCAREVVESYNGRFPEAPEELEKLPGIGPYTAGAIASIAYDRPAAVLDGNVMRVLSRLIDLEECVDDAPVRTKLWAIARELAPEEGPGDFNQAMMELGARICTPRQPDCEHCPAADDCLARLRGTQGERPVRKKKAKTPHHEIVVGAIRRNGAYLLGKRPSSGLLGGLWEFPGGKVEAGEDHAAALKREIEEETGLRVEPGGLIATVNHAYSHFKVTLNVYACEWAGGEPRARTHDRLEWASPKDFDLYAFPKANHKFLHLIREREEQNGVSG
jgi:A/G-specific adenine glycosylase